MAKLPDGDENAMRDYAIILAADLPSSDQVTSLVKEVAPAIDGLKIGVPTLLESGIDILSKLSDMISGKPLLVDLKVADIGFNSKGQWAGTNSKIISKLKGTGATSVTVHGFPGPASIAEAVERAHEIGIEVLLLPTMSHPGAELFFSLQFNSVTLGKTSDQNIARGLNSLSNAVDVTEAILKLGETYGVDGYIGPATRPQDLEKYREITSKPIWCPGFGRQDRLGRNIGQQLEAWGRIVGPNSAAIVGSFIFEAESPHEAAISLLNMRDEIAG